MNDPLIVLVIAQIVWASSDLLARSQMRSQPWGLHLLAQPWLYGYLLLQLTGITLQLYVFSHFELAKTITLLAVLGVFASVVLGWLVLGEKLSAQVYVAIILATIALLLLAFARR